LALMFARSGDPFQLLADCVDRYGDVYSLPLGPGGTTVVNDPQFVGDWLIDYSRYHKGVKGGLPGRIIHRHRKVTR
jgi:enediyne biosynthesis protein E7